MSFSLCATRDLEYLLLENLVLDVVQRRPQLDMQRALEILLDHSLSRRIGLVHDFDLVQLAHVIDVCRASDAAADAARRLYAVSFKTKTSSNSSDRLSKYLARFGLKFKSIIRPAPISSHPAT